MNISVWIYQLFVTYKGIQIADVMIDFFVGIIIILNLLKVYDKVKLYMCNI